MSQPDPLTLNVQGVEQLVSSKMNKVSSGATGIQEGQDGDQIDELTLKLDDEELLALANEWENAYKGYEAGQKAKGERNKTFYLGRQKDGTPTDVKDLPIAGNLIFEAEETFLPAALAKNPEPVVYADNSDAGNKLSSDVKTMLQYHADVLVLRRKLALMVRHWSIYHLSVIKHGWNNELKDITSEVRDIRNFIFDPKATVDVYGDMEGYIGERVTVSARKLCKLFPQHTGYITIMVDGKMGTNVTYTEWWNDDYSFVTFKNKVLEKNKNQYFAYSKPQQGVDQYGMPLPPTEPKNHFASPKKPYTFLSVFSLGEQPHDITGLIEQNIPNQNLVTRRTLQIDRNLNKSNNSIGLSAANFNQQTGKQAAAAMEAGDPVLIPSGGPVSEAIARFPAQAVPDSFFKDLESNKEALRSSFGTQGITSQQPTEDTTARGMILNQQFDNTRIGGGIGDALAQVADNIFNWWVQLYYVFYDEEHFAAVMGQMKATEYITLSNQSFGSAKLIISVAAGSMKSRDEISEINQAIEFFQMGAIGPKTLLTIADFPNVDESAADGVLWKIDPASYFKLNFPDEAAKLQQAQQEQMQQEQAAQQMQMQQQGAQAEQQLQQKGAAANQQLQQKEQLHAQKLTHAEQAFAQKQNQLGGAKANPSLKMVGLPK